jgi:single-strand DNA-binding protein
MNSFNAIGRTGKDAQTRYTQGGKAVTSWSLAVDTGWGDNKKTVWLDCSLWGERGEKVAQYLTKGAQVGVQGEIGTRDHEGKTYITLNVANVTLVGKGQDKPASKPSSKSDDVLDDDIPF